jgi:hypothetical protein
MKEIRHKGTLLAAGHFARLFFGSACFFFAAAAAAPMPAESSRKELEGV